MSGLSSDAVDALRLISRSDEETRRLGQLLGEIIVTGTTVALSGDLGSGKTVFVQGLAKGLEVPEAYYVTSPTYTIMNEFPGRLRLFHVDLYRLTTPDEMEEIGLDELFSGTEVIAVEWPERLPHRFFGNHISVSFTVSGDDVREIILIPYGQAAADLIGKIKNRM